MSMDEMRGRGFAVGMTRREVAVRALFAGFGNDEARVKDHVGTNVGNLWGNGRGRALAREGEWWQVRDGLSGVKATDPRPRLSDREPTGLTHGWCACKCCIGRALRDLFRACPRCDRTLFHYY